MKLRMSCSNCRASFLVSGEPLPEFAKCPECGNKARVPAIQNSSEARDNVEGVSVFVPSSKPEAKPEAGLSWGKYLAIGLCLLLLGVVLSSWPWLKSKLWNAEPKDPVERVAASYLNALIHDDEQAAKQLGAIEDPPAIRSFGQLARIKDRDQTVRGKFGPIAKLNKRIDTKFSFDPKIGRFTPKNPLGAAGETLDALHEAKEKAENSNVFGKMASPDPNEALNAIDDLKDLGAIFNKLADGALSPKRILPTYPMLVNEAKPPLSDTEKKLALDYGENPEVWDVILKRPFLTIRADGPYILERAEVEASVQDKLASLGDPPSRLRLKLIRFRLEGIDTGWKVVAAQRVSEIEESEASEPPDATKARGERSTESPPSGPTDPTNSLGEPKSKR